MLDEIVDQHPSQVAYLAYHTWWPGPADPYYNANLSDANTRINYYGADYTPHAYFDGSIDGESGGPWEQTALNRAAVSSPLSIVVSGDPILETITADITNTSASPITGILYFTITENGLFFGGHPHNHTMRDFLPDANGTPIALAASGGNTMITEPYTLDPGWVEENLECIVFVQEDDGSKEILQTAKIYFRLDEPELAVNGTLLDDSVGGDGNGNLDLGESADLVLTLANLNPPAASSITATLTTSDPNLTIVDGSATWADLVYGAEADNAGDVFTISADANAPWGHEAAVTLTISASPSYVKTIDFVVAIGSPENPMGADPYGYYVYEDTDAYGPSPTFDWLEIDPNLGGSGTLISLGDDQVAFRTLPFDVKFYGETNNDITISSNGFLVLSSFGDASAGNYEIPSSSGPPRMMAGFWVDLNPAASGSGKVYEYQDVANDRYIVEWSGVEHYHDLGQGVPETFQIILYDRVAHPTQTGDTQIDYQYLVVTDASGCTVGIENATETIGSQYLFASHLNAAATGLVSGRAIRLTTTPPGGIVDVAASTVPLARLGVLAKPNPFRGRTAIHYAVPTAGEASLQIFGPDGGLVRTLIKGGVTAGESVIAWDGRNDSGIRMPAGVYLYRLSAPGFEKSGKVVRVN